MQGLRKIPVVEGGMGRDAVAEQCVDELLVEIDSLLVDRAPAIREDARPRDAEAVVLHAEVGHQLHVLRVPVVEVAGCIAGISVVGPARRVAEGVPDARFPAVLGHSPLDLIGGRCCPPMET